MEPIKENDKLKRMFVQGQTELVDVQTRYKYSMVARWLSNISASRSLLIICSGVNPFLAISTPLLRDYNCYRLRT